MGKKAQKRSSIPAKDNASWLRSFVSIFEFSQSYNLRKLLADRRRGSARYPGTSFSGNNISEDTWESKYEHGANVDGREDTLVFSRLPSIKTLIEEEMSKERTPKASGCNIKSNRKMTKNNKNDSDPWIKNLWDSALKQFKCREQVEGSNLMFDLAALMIEFYSVSRYCSDICEEIEVDLCGPLRSSPLRSRCHRKHTNLDESDSQLAYRHSRLQEALVVEAEAFLSQKIDDAKRLVGNGVIHSQEFMDALEILNSNKELFLKLVQHPNSLVFSHIQELLKPQAADFSKLEAVHCLEGSDHLEEKLGNSDQNGKSSSNQMFQKKKQHFLSNKNDKFRGEIAPKIRNTSKEMNKIVVLKPHLSRKHDDSTQNSPCLSPQSRYSKKLEKDSERTVSYFSFREIKRKLRYIIADSKKEKHLISQDSFSVVPFDYKGSTDTFSMTSTESTITNVTSHTDRSTENIYQYFPSNRKVDKKSKAKECQQKVEAETTQCKIQGLSLFSLFHAESSNEEAENHFSEMLSTEYRTANLTNNQISKYLEKMDSPSDYNLLSPRFNSHRVKELNSFPHEIFSSPRLQLIDDTSVNLSPEQSLKETPHLSSDLDVEIPVINTEAANDKVGLQEETCIGEQPNTEGRKEIVEIENVKSIHTNPGEECNTLYIAVASVGGENGPSCESCKDGCSMPSEQGTPYEKPRILIPTASISPCSLIINHFESSEFIIEKPERPSPVSVLEQLFLEDDASPDRPSIKFNEMHKPVKPIHLNFHEDSAVVITTSDCLIAHQRICSYDMEIATKYVRTMLETYSFDSEMSPEKWPSSELLLQPSLLDEIKSLKSSCPEDPKLLLDCVNEVLIEMKDQRFQISPWVSFLKPRVQLILKDFIIQEVCKTIESYLSTKVQSTINEIMRKDMGSAMWMDHRLEMECIIAEMGCNICEELMEEIIFELFL